MSKTNDCPAPTRRDLLLGAGALAGAAALAGPGRTRLRADHPGPKAKATPFKLDDQPKRVRKSFHDLSDDEVRTFANAVGYLRDRPPIHDPLQWDNLVSMHAHHCTEASGQDNLQVHWSYFFLPWHRAYLYFVERHLANTLAKQFDNKPISGDQFALPYWDWVTHKNIPNTSAREMAKKASPLFGLDPSEDLGADKPDRYNLALFDGYRGPTLDKPDMNPDNEPTKGWKEYTKLIRDHNTSPAQINSILSMQNFCIFGGFPITDEATGQGLLENIPHNTIHDWVGTRCGSNRDMGSLRYAALDPIFYLHHCNIDRIWSLYRFTPDPDGKPATNCFPTPEALKQWADQTFEFTDIDGKTVSVTVRDTIKNMNNVTYEESPRGSKLTVASADKAAAVRTAPLLAKTTRLTNDKPGTVTVAAKAMLKDSKDVRAGEPKSAVLEVVIGDFAYQGRFQARVFVNKEDATRETPLGDEHFVGSFQVLDSHSGKSERKDGKHRFFVDVSPTVSNFFKVAPAGKDFKLTLVAVGGSPREGSFYLDVASVTLHVYE